MKTSDLKLNYQTHYVEELKLKYHAFKDTLRFTLLENAMKKGQYCLEFTLSNSEWNKNVCDIVNELEAKFETITEALEVFKTFVTDKTYGSFEIGKMTITFNKIKSIRVFSPFVSLPKLTKEPKKWRVSDCVKALLNNQVKAFCDGIYTDDYAFDAAYSFQMGEVKDNKSLGERILQSPEGWWCLKRPNGEIILSCHSFENYTLNLTI